MSEKIGNKKLGQVREIAKPFISVFLALLCGGIIIEIIGEDMGNIYQIMFTGAFGNRINIAETLIKSTTLIFTGMSYAFAYKCGLINIGAEGQLYMGAALSTWIGVNLTGLPAAVHIPIALLAGFLGGALLGGLVGWLKTRFDANEVITTVMLNYVAQYLVSWLVTGPMKEQPGDFPQTAMTQESAYLLNILPGTRLHMGFVLAIIALVLYGVFLWHTSSGYEMRIVGQNNKVAAYAGMNVKGNVMAAMFIAGGCGGLAGAMEILGVQHRLLQNFSSGYGFDGIAVSLLGSNNPLGIFLSSILFGALKSGGNAVQMFSNVPAAIINIIQALVIIFVVIDLVSKLWRKKMVK